MESLDDYLVIDSPCAGEKTTAINLPVDRIVCEHGAEPAIIWCYGGTRPFSRHELRQFGARAMFSVIFEVNPKQEKFDLYLDLAKGLKPILEGIDGFIDNERFESTRRPGWILSHSTWRDEKSVVRWRTVAKHHDTQAGRSSSSGWTRRRSGGRSS